MTSQRSRTSQDTGYDVAFGSFEDAKTMVGATTPVRFGGVEVNAGMARHFAAMVHDGNASFWDEDVEAAESAIAAENDKRDAARCDVQKQLAAHWEALCSNDADLVLATLAVAPGIRCVSGAAVRFSDADAYGNRQLECLLAAQFSRERLRGIRWSEADAFSIVHDASTDLAVRLGGRSKLEMKPIDLGAHPDLAAMLSAIDFDEER